MSAVDPDWPLARVRWVDSHGFHGWNRLSHITESNHSLECVSVGWIVVSNDERLVLVAHVQSLGDSDPQCDGQITIPRQAILAVEKL